MIDESYEDIEDDLDRLTACMKATVPEYEILQLVADCERVFEHNFRFLSEGLAVHLKRDLAQRILPLCFSVERLPM